jgi:hypothetical protein
MQKAIVTAVQNSLVPEPVVRSSCTDAITSNEQYNAMNPSADIAQVSSILGQQASATSDDIIYAPNIDASDDTSSGLCMLAQEVKGDGTC